MKRQAGTDNMWLPVCSLAGGGSQKLCSLSSVRRDRKKDSENVWKWEIWALIVQQLKKLKIEEKEELEENKQNKWRNGRD